MRFVLVFVTLIVAAQGQGDSTQQALVPQEAIQVSPATKQTKQIELAAGESAIDLDTTRSTLQHVKNVEYGIDVVVVMGADQSSDCLSASNRLRYWLRGVERNSGKLIRKIHVVVPDEHSVPAWLVKSGNKIDIVAHSLLFDETAAVPASNIFAIEANIHRIPGLAEHFCYMKDNQLISSALQRSDLFDKNGDAVSRFDTKLSSASTMSPDVAAVVATTDALLEKQLGFSLRPEFTSSSPYLFPKPLLKSDLEKAETMFFSAVLQTSQHTKAVSPSDVSLVRLADGMAIHSSFTSHMAPWAEVDHFAIVRPGVQSMDDQFTALRTSHPKMVSVPLACDAEARGPLAHHIEHLLPISSAFEK